MLATLH
jgi:hypothetical protein